VKYSRILGAVSSDLFALLCVIGIAAPLAAQASKPIAYVYVSSNNNGNNQIHEFYALPNGQLATIPGSPYPQDVSYMAVTHQWLFGTDGANIYWFTIASNGEINQRGVESAQQYNDPGGCGGPITLFLDHTGATLYDGDIYANQCANNGYQYWAIDENGGTVTFLGLNPSFSVQYGQALSFIGNNKYAYGANCYHYNDPVIFGFQRADNGVLTLLDINPELPPAPEGEYCPFYAAADPNNNVAISMFPSVDGTQAGPPQIADYAADSEGNLTTQSTANNMPVTSVSVVNSLAMAPSGQLLAVGGNSGLQVLHWNGSSQATLYTPLLTSDNITQAFWDDANHLFAISPANNRLHVFTVTPTSYSEAPGSPYTIQGAENVIVLPK
jgi:WD40 repeat protein